MNWFWMLKRFLEAIVDRRCVGDMSGDFKELVSYSMAAAFNFVFESMTLLINISIEVVGHGEPVTEAGA